MADPWDDDEVVKPKSTKNPWDDDEVVGADAAPREKITMRPQAKEGSLKSSAVGQLLGLTDLGSNAIDAAVKLPGKMIPALAQWNRTRNADRELFADERSDSTAFKANRLVGNVASTLPVGGVLGAGVKAAAPALVGAGASARVVHGLSNSLASGGFRLGTSANSLGAGTSALMRAAGGAATGGATAGALNPNDAGTGAVIGAALPGFLKLTGAAGGVVADLGSAGAKRLMQSAIKPTIEQLRTGEAKTAIQTMLKYGINPTEGGVSKLRSIIDGMNDDIAAKIAGSGASVSKQKVLGALADVRTKFGDQVSPTGDLNKITGVADDFVSHPNYLGDMIPVQGAQKMKQGTYKVLNKKFGEVGSAETEAQKALARGLKEEIAEAVPGVGALNAEESKLLATLGVAERRALMSMNNNPLGLAALAGDPKGFMMFMADKSVLFKSLAARMLNSSVQGAQSSAPQLSNRLSNPLLRNPLTVAAAHGDVE
jgi:hypothetical protein